MCLKPSGRGEHECVVHIPNEFKQRLTPPGWEDFKELEQISEGAITSKCVLFCYLTALVDRAVPQRGSW
jgi:hypothetical protein